ncbi:MAG: isoaspartyl peptidase/L-asparaginase family protein [Candidatus Bipolaricaulota bacterium]
MKITVHGGAGKIPEEDQPERKRVIEEAAAAGLAEESPLDAVIAAVKLLEENPLFNAGYGGSLQMDGQVRLDAAVMKDDLSSGGVINVERVKHPIAAARRVMEDSPHVLLGCRGATEFADQFGLTTSEDLNSPRATERWEEASANVDGLGYAEKLARLEELIAGHDTVGAVAWDGGKMAAGTSTGGLRYQMFGRVGDSPIVGSGLYCNEYGAVSATGTGEAIIKVNLARELVYHVENGKSPQRGAEESIQRLEESTNSQAGVIAIDREGRVGAAYNTRDMQYSVKED